MENTESFLSIREAILPELATGVSAACPADVSCGDDCSCGDDK